MEKNSNTRPKLTKADLKKKLIKFLLFAYIITIALIVVINHFAKNDKNIYSKIGSNSPVSISIKDALNIKGYGVLPYVDYIKAGDTKAAYEMLTDEYRKTFSYEEYLKTIEGINFETFDMKQIKLKAEGTYVATMVYERNGEQKETDYLLYLNPLNPKIITISPDKFIYSYNDLKFKMDNIELQLQKCIIHTDYIEMKALIKNKSLFDTMTFTNIGVGYNEVMNKSENIDFTLEPGEIKEIDINYETQYYIPNNITLKRMVDADTLRTYTFYFKDAK